MLSFTKLAALMALVPATIGCPMTKEESSNFKTGEIVTNEAVCVPQGEGAWTFGFITSMTSWPSADWPTSNGFLIMDNACVLRGFYQPDQTACGVPWEIQDNFLPHTIVVDTVNLGVGDPAIYYTYGAGSYGIEDGYCTSVDLKPLTASKACKQAFPINGDGS